MKMTRENIFIGLAIFGLFLILGMPSLPSNKELPTGVYRSGVVIAWAANGPEEILIEVANHFSGILGENI